MKVAASFQFLFLTYFRLFLLCSPTVAKKKTTTTTLATTATSPRTATGAAGAIALSQRVLNDLS